MWGHRACGHQLLNREQPGRPVTATGVGIGRHRMRGAQIDADDIARGATFGDGLILPTGVEFDFPHIGVVASDRFKAQRPHFA